jgi:hypothetical protein
VVLGLAEKVGSRLGLSQAEVVGGSRRRRVVEGRNLVSYVAVHGYGMGLTQVGKGLKISIQSVLRGVDSGGEDFQDRRWGLKDFIK